MFLKHIIFPEYSEIWKQMVGIIRKYEISDFLCLICKGIINI